MLEEAKKIFSVYQCKALPIVHSKGTLAGMLSRGRFDELLVYAGYPDALLHKHITECFLAEDPQVYAAHPVTDIRRIASLLVDKALDASGGRGR